MNDSGNRINYGDSAAVREPATGKGRPGLISPFALTRLAKWYEKGAEKYAPYNWTKGMPYSRYTDSIGRHYIAWLAGDDSEDHLAAICWNACSLMHHQELGEDEKWNDMPRWKDKDWYESIGATDG